MVLAGCAALYLSLMNGLIHFISYLLFFWRESKIQYSSPRTWNTSRFSAISDTVAPLTLQQDRTKQGQSVIMPPGSWVTSDHWAVFPCV